MCVVVCFVVCGVTALLVFVHAHSHKNTHIIYTCKRVNTLIHPYVHILYVHSNTYIHVLYTQAGRDVNIEEEQIDIISDTSSPTGNKIKLVFKITMPAERTYVRLCVWEKGRMYVCVCVCDCVCMCV
jgi:hypothetical protein